MISAPPSLTAKVDAYFTGRTWLLPKLLKWWDESDERIFLLKGEPGTGKSMILTWLAGAGPLPLDSVSREQLVDLRAAVRATHFCQAATGSNAPEAFAENIARQLSGSVPGFADAISAVLSDRIHIVGTAEAGTAASGSTVAGVAIGQINLLMASDELSFDRKLISPLKKLYESGFAGPLLILIDALDEALTYSGVTIVDLISRLKDLPSPIRILATTRKEPRVLKYFQNGETFDLVCDAPHEANDVRDYASQRLKILNSVGDDKRSEFASRLANHAKGIFLYASMVLDELLQISPSHFPELDTYPLPEGLSGIYIDFLNRELSRNEIQWFGVYEPLLGLIAVARGEGLTARQLSNIAGTDVRAALRNVKQYLRGELPNGPFRTFHESFTDFLLDERRNLHFHIDAERWNRKIVDYYCETCGGEWKRGDIYGESHLLRHAIFGNAIDRLDELLTNVDFIVSAEPNSVVEALPYAKCDKARDMAWIYGHNVHLFRDSSRGERLSYFELSASQNRLPNLLWPIPDRVQTKHWSTAWTDCKPAPRYFALQGHHADITSTASGTQNGRLCLASGDSCGEVKIWDLQSGHFLRSLPDRRPFRINVLKW